MRMRYLIQHYFLRLNSSTTVLYSSKYAASKIFNGRNSFWVFVWFTHIYVSALFSWSLSLYSYTEYYCCIVAIYDVRSSHIVITRTGLKSRSIWDWSAVIHTLLKQPIRGYTCKMGRDLVRVAVYQSITIRRRMMRVGALMYGLWFAQSSPKTVES